MHNEYGVFLGPDVGKQDHHAVALDPAGKRLHDAPLPNTEAGLRKLFDKLARRVDTGDDTLAYQPGPDTAAVSAA